MRIAIAQSYRVAQLRAIALVHNSPTVDEPGHIVAGIYVWQLGRFDLYGVNPPLFRTIASALAVAFVAPTTDWSVPLGAPRMRPEWAVAQEFIQINKWENAFQCFVFGRWICIVFGVLGACICCRWSHILYGNVPAILALSLWCFCANILGWSSIVTPDVPAATVGAVAMYCFWRWLKNPNWNETIVVGVGLGLAELCKFTLLIFYPLLPLLWLIYRVPERKAMTRWNWLGQGGMILVAMFLSVYVVNCGYLFEGTFTKLEDFRFQTMLFTGCKSLNDVSLQGANRFARTWLGKLPVPIPANMLQGIDMQRLDFERGLSSYLYGQWADHGWWYYYLYALAIKMPLGTWGLVLLAIGVTIFDWWHKKPCLVVPFPKNKGSSYLPVRFSASWRDEMIVFVPGLTLLIFVSSQTGFSVHSRYIIPVLPFLFVWTSKVAKVFDVHPFNKKQLAMASMVVLMLAWSVGSSLLYYPHSLSYFNELVGGPIGGPKYLLDSNIDWGQDLFYLKDWLNKHSKTKLNGLAYWGSYPATLAGIPETPMPPVGKRNESDISGKADQFGPMPGWYALSVNYIYGRDRQYRYFLHFEPVAMAGYSIYIYHIKIEEANRVRRELGVPELKEEKAEGGGQHG